MRKFHPSHQKYDPENSSVLRYIRAGLQPFKRPLFLGSAAVLAVIAVCSTLYWQHPEWLNTTIEQPDVGEPGLDLDPVAPVEGAVDSTGAEFGSEVPAQPPAEISEVDPEAADSPSIFPDLIGRPSEEGETSSDLVERSSFDNYRSFIDGSRRGTSPSNLGENGGAGAINEGAINNIPAARPAPSRDNPLQDAVERAFSDQSESVEEEASVTPLPNTAPSPNADRQQRIRDFNTFTDTSDSAPYGTVPLNPRSYGTDLGTQPNNSGRRSRGDRFNNYDFNNSFSPSEQPQERFEQNNFDSSPYEQYEENYLGTTEVTPGIEIQEPIQIEQPEFE